MAATPATAKSPRRCANSAKPQPLPPGRPGNSTATTISSGSSTVVSGATKKSRAAISRPPAPLAVKMRASSRTAIDGSSAAGSAWDRLPPIVPRLRIARWATCFIASCRTGNRCLTAAEVSSAKCRTSAPTRSPPSAVSSIRPRPSIPLISTNTGASTTRKFSIGTRLCPPASSLASPPAAARAATASSTVDARTYSKGAGFI